MILFRPIGEKEKVLIEAADFMKFPPRLPEQPIFYPVCNYEYAYEIAEKWNKYDLASGLHGYVTKFEIDDRYISKFEAHIVGSGCHEEYWIPAVELENFNNHIIGKIIIVAEIN